MSATPERDRTCPSHESRHHPVSPPDRADAGRQPALGHHTAPDGRPRTLPRGRRYTAFRDRVRTRPGVNAARRCGVGVLGAVVLVAGVIMIPYPGPGWLVVFVALAILGTEFAWAKHLLDHARARYDRWNVWQRRQHGLVRLAVLAATAAVVLLTLWILGALGLAAGWLGVDWPALESPLGRLA